MKIRTLALVGALGLAAFALPTAAEAGHRHSRSCGHYTHYDRGYRPYVRGHARGYSGYYGGPYLYGYAPAYVYSPVPVYPPYPRYYYAPRRHARTHVSVALGFGF
jgi:hypothetical protein